MFKSCGLGGQRIDTRNGHSFSDRTFTQGLKIIRKKPHAFVFCALLPLNRYLALCPSRQSQLLHMASPCSMMTSLITPQRYMVTIALRVPGCRQPSRHRWHGLPPIMTHTNTTQNLFIPSHTESIHTFSTPTPIPSSRHNSYQLNADR